METLMQDLRHAFRLLSRRPGFVAVAVLSLALGIGGNALIFGFVDGFVLRPFPLPDPDRVVGIGVTFPRVSEEEGFIEVSHHFGSTAPRFRAPRCQLLRLRSRATSTSRHLECRLSRAERSPTRIGSVLLRS